MGMNIIQMPCNPGNYTEKRTGAHDAYNRGDKVSYNGKHYISTIDNNVWEPGVYGWEAVTE